MLLVMRHGEAVVHAATDFDRELTVAGRAEVGRSCERLLAQRVTPTHIVASPLVRARQTARIVRKRFGLQSAVGTWEEIAPEGQCERVAGKLELEAGIPMLVSHQPFVGRFIEYLTGVRAGMDTADVAGIRCEVFERACASLEWIIRSG